MKNKIVEWEHKDINKEAEVPQKEKQLSKEEILAKYDWAKKMKSKKDEDGYEYTPSWKISKKIIKFFEEKYLNWKNYSLLFGSMPLMFVWFILFFNLFSHSLTWEEILDYAKFWAPIIIFLSLFIFCICYYGELKTKRLYQQVCNWTIESKEVEIIGFDRHVPTWEKKNYGDSWYDPNQYWFSIIATDWKRKYESDWFSDRKLWLNYSKFYIEKESYDTLMNSRLFRLWRLLRIIKPFKLPPREYITINNKKYSIGDKVTVYIDSKWKWNYCLYIPEN